MTALGMPVETSRRLPLSLPEDDRDLAAAVRGFLRSVVPPPTADSASWAQLDPDRRLWRRMATELGIPALSVPEHLSGHGYGISQLAVVFEELGRSLCPAPFLGTVGLATRALVHVADSALQADLLARIAAGDAYAALALEPSPDAVGLVAASGSAGDALLDGTVSPLVDGDLADVLVVVASGADGLGLYAVELDHDSVRRAPMAALDLTRGVATVSLRRAPAVRLDVPGSATAILARVESEAMILLSSESVGAARAALGAAVDYAKVRTQFGRQLGSFQALKHRMADMLGAVEGAWAVTRHAAVLADQPHVPAAELELAARMAKAAASDALSFVAAENIQIHGGIGFTWEHTAHLYYRRAHSSAILLGLPAAQRDRIAALLTTAP